MQGRSLIKRWVSLYALIQCWQSSQVVGSKPKVEYYCKIAKAIFDVEGEAECKMYVLDPEHYAMSVMGRITQ